jgi:predicted transcriptional regulator
MGSLSWKMGSGPVRPPLLGELETAVMEHFWDGGAGDVKAVHQALGKPRRITLNTIHSTLKRLYEKELLARDKVSHAHVYRPRVSRTEFQRSTLGELIDELMGGQAEMMVSTFVDLTERAGPEHMARLETLVAERRRALAKGRR